MAIEYIDLMLDNGELIRIEYKDKYIDEMFEYMENCIKRKDTWSASRFEGTKATYMGVDIERVNTAKVVGAL